MDASALVAEALAMDASLPLAAGGGALAKEMVRVNHYGVDADRDVVESSVAALGAALARMTGTAVDVAASRRAVTGTWA